MTTKTENLKESPGSPFYSGYHTTKNHQPGTEYGRKLNPLPYPNTISSGMYKHDKPHALKLATPLVVYFLPVTTKTRHHPQIMQAVTSKTGFQTYQ
ncbi:hypothetical protein RIR_jg5665.t1 [Rhizophagus irregularis DAOM 181602=DAOM 197198]|nr:hypothetical protein RIR_jg5665.t1 [Rhizophagus irregularis DAOM 181602=DAOM 197198]